jgi:hypothetical protein
MTLKEKFKKATSQWFDTTECEKIADDYAIEFAEWLMDCHISKLTLKEFKKQKEYESIV